jgi:hypothetical protein
MATRRLFLYVTRSVILTVPHKPRRSTKIKTRNKQSYELLLGLLLVLCRNIVLNVGDTEKFKGIQTGTYSSTLIKTLFMWHDTNKNVLRNLHINSGNLSGRPLRVSTQLHQIQVEVFGSTLCSNCHSVLSVVSYAEHLVAFYCDSL